MPSQSHVRFRGIASEAADAEPTAGVGTAKAPRPPYVRAQVQRLAPVPQQMLLLRALRQQQLRLVLSRRAERYHLLLLALQRLLMSLLLLWRRRL